LEMEADGGDCLLAISRRHEKRIASSKASWRHPPRRAKSDE